MPSHFPYWLPTPIVIHAAVVVVVLAAVSVVKGLGDPDYYWHVTAGRLIVETGVVPSVDQFSFTWQGRPWTPHEWLSEVAMHLVASGTGPGATLLLFGAVAAAAIAVVSVALSRSGLRTATVALPATLAALVFLPYVTARPQAVSWLLLGIELVILMRLRSDRPARALLLVPLFAVWANLHGVYVVGLGVAGVYLLFTLAGRTRMAAARGWMLAAAIGAGLASMLTPAGPAGLLYPLRYVDGSDWGLANIQEWQSPNFHEPAHLAFLGLILAVVICGGRGTPGWMSFLAYGGIIMGLLALRNAPIAAILAMPTLSHTLDACLPGRHADQACPRSLAVGRRIIELAIGVAVAVSAWVILMPANADAASLEVARSKFPTKAVTQLRSIDPDARVVAEYGWAGYVIHELHRT
ncbi:MAG: hypothetical protein M3153_00505, partial [Chloroflexota bacterium]|nr:hypothetical protein [Chloroflexota bacterium]